MSIVEVEKLKNCISYRKNSVSLRVGFSFAYSKLKGVLGRTAIFLIKIQFYNFSKVAKII